MSVSNPGGSQSAADRLVDELLEIHRLHRSDTAKRRHGELFRHLDKSLQSLDPSDADRTLREVTGKLRQRDAESNTEVASGGEAERLKAEVARLEGQVLQLLKENEALKQQPPAAASGADDGLPRIREGLSRFLRRDEVPVDALGLPDDDGRFFELVRELLRFALDFEMMGVNPLLKEIEVDSMKGMDTQMWTDLQQNVRDRFRECLDGKEGSVDSLRDILNHNTRFFMYLNLSYHDAIQKGTQSMLTELEHQAILQEHKQLLGHDYGAAWKRMTGIYDDLTSRPARDLWEQFFLPPFRDKLSAYLEKSSKR